ncbi:MAG: hypothetical protein WBQ16_06955 [Nitrososphaeraceae archaeon]
MQSVTLTKAHNRIYENCYSLTAKMSSEYLSATQTLPRREHCFRVKNNDDNNCNDTHKTQKIKAKNESEIENENKDHSHNNENLNELTCVNEAQNLKDVEQVDVFESNDTLV